MDPRLRGDDDQEAIPRPRYSATSPATSTMAPATRSCRLSIARICSAMRLNASGKANSTSPSSTATRHSAVRSEEHTSELQSLMRISYAVFCLQNKNIEKTEVTNDK